MTRFTRGAFTFKLLDAGQFHMNAATLFANAPADVLSAVLAKHDIDPGHIIFRVNPLYVHTGAQQILIDPGLGEPDPVLPHALQAAGIDPAAIDAVILTHGHPDHLSGCITPDNQPAFPNAQYFVQRAEWEYWFMDGNPEPHHAAFFRQTLEPIADHFTLLDNAGEVVPGIEALLTPGHSPGHMVLRIGAEMLHVGDILLNPVHIEHPDWFAAFDQWPQQVVETRRTVLARLAEENLLAITFHFGVGRVQSAGESWRWIPETL